jgi:hypothetical protein
MLRDTPYFTVEKLIISPLYKIDMRKFKTDTEFNIFIKYSLNDDVIRNKLYYDSGHKFITLNLFEDSDGNPLYIIKFLPFGPIDRREFAFELLRYNQLINKYDQIMYINKSEYRRVENQLDILNMVDNIVLRPKYYNGFESILIENINTKMMVRSMNLLCA